MKDLYKKLIFAITLFGCFIWCFNFYTFADETDVEWLTISHKLTTWEVEHTNQRIKIIWSHPGEVWPNIHKAHEDLTLRERLAVWILDIDDIMNYMVYVVRFFSQLWLLIWAGFIMFAWYKYMLSVFNWWKTPSSTLKNAIIGVLIIIFSYAIMKILTSIIWLT